MSDAAHQGPRSRRPRGRLAPPRAVALALALWVPAALLPSAPAAADEVAARLLAAAVQRQEAGELEAALTDLRQIVQQFPGSAEAADALLRIARGLRESGKPDEAEKVADRLVTEYALWPQAADALVLLGEIQTERATSWEELENARNTLAKVELLFDAAAHPTLEARSAAGVRRGSLALLAGAVDDAAAHFLDVLEREPRSRWTSEAQLGLASARLAEGDWDAAAEALQGALDSDPEGAAGRRAAAQLALLERFVLRPETGGKRWSRATMLASPVALERPAGIAALPDGALAVADEAENVAVLLTPEGRAGGSWSARGVAHPSGDGRGAVLLPADDAVAIVPGRRRLTFSALDRDRALDGILAVERGLLGSWFVAASRSDGLVLYDADGKRGRSLTDRSIEPADLAADARRRVYLLDARGGRVLRYGADGSAPETVLNGSWRKPQALATDPLGNLYVLDADSNRVEVYDRAGKRLEGLGPTLPGGIALRKPTDVAVGLDGRIYVADSRLGVVVID